MTPPSSEMFQAQLPPRSPAQARPGISPAAVILPVLIVLAALVLGYLLLNRGGTERDGGDAAMTAADGSTREAGAAPRRAVNEAADAGDLAARRGDVVSAAALDSAFFADREAADLRYPGPVTVQGMIASMVQPGATPSLSMEGRNRFNYMVVSFPSGYGPRLAPLTKGQVVTVTCDTIRSLGGTTLLSGCELP